MVPDTAGAGGSRGRPAGREGVEHPVNEYLDRGHQFGGAGQHVAPLGELESFPGQHRILQRIGQPRENAPIRQDLRARRPLIWDGTGMEGVAGQEPGILERGPEMPQGCVHAVAELAICEGREQPGALRRTRPVGTIGALRRRSRPAEQIDEAVGRVAHGRGSDMQAGDRLLLPGKRNRLLLCGRRIQLTPR